MDDVGIVIPAFRPDPDRLTSYVHALEEAIDPGGVHLELDRPSSAVLREIEDLEVTAGVAHRRRGKGAAITAGFDRLDTSILAFVDADGSTPPPSLGAVLDPLREGRADLAVGSRRHPEAHVLTHQSFVRRHLGDAFPWLARRILPMSLYDYQCGAKAVRRATWLDVRDHLVSPGFAWDIEFVSVAKALGARIAEVPIVWEDQPGTTVGIAGTALEFAIALVRSWHRAGCITGARSHELVERIVGRPTPVIADETYRSTVLSPEGP